MRVRVRVSEGEGEPEGECGATQCFSGPIRARSQDHEVPPVLAMC